MGELRVEFRDQKFGAVLMLMHPTPTAHAPDGCEVCQAFSSWLDAVQEIVAPADRAVGPLLPSEEP